MLVGIQPRWRLALVVALMWSSLHFSCTSTPADDFQRKRRRFLTGHNFVIQLPLNCQLVSFLGDNGADETNGNLVGDNAVVLDPAISLLTRFLSKGDTVLDLMGGCGISFAALAAAVGPSGRVVGVEYDEERMNALYDTALENNIWTRVLLVHCMLEATEHRYILASDILAVNRPSTTGLQSNKTVAADELDLPLTTVAPKTTLEKVVGLIGGTNSSCPTVIRIGGYQFTAANDSDVLDEDIYKALLGSRHVLETCGSVVYLTCASNRTASTLFRWFFAPLKYQLYRLKTPGLVAGEAFVPLQQIAVLAIPFSRRALDWKSELSEFNIEPMLLLPHTGNEIRVPVTVSLEDFLPPESLLYSSSPGISKPNAGDSLSVLLGDLQSVTTDYVDGDGSHSDSLGSTLLDQAEIVCVLWSSRVLHGIIDCRSTDRCNAFNLQDDAALLLEEVQWVKHCTAHIYRRLIFVWELFATRTATITEHPTLDREVAMEEHGSSANAASLIDQSMLQEDDPDNNIDAPNPQSDYTFYDLNTSLLLPTRSFQRAPFERAFDWNFCGEPIWCSHTNEMQKLIHRWQHPLEPSFAAAAEPVGFEVKYRALGLQRTCNNTKLLLYEPPSPKMGIGALFQLLVAAMRYAICLDRILVLNWREERTMTKWRHPGCQGSTFECYFQPISSCAPSVAEIDAAHYSFDGNGFEEYPLRNEKVLVLRGIPSTGECQTCYSPWRRDSSFFDGYFIGNTKQLPKASSQQLFHMGAFMSMSKETWTAQFLRYLLRPRAWFSQVLDQIIDLSLYSPTALSRPVNSSSHRVPGENEVSPHHLPSEFISLHVRYGMKIVEQELQPLSRYMGFIRKKLSHLKDVFVSTETASVIETLVREYPEYRFHYLRYNRVQYLPVHLDLANNEKANTTDYVYEFLHSLANLRVAAEASGFVGTLSSNWCMMIMQLERTRGDGGSDYFSVDAGSAYRLCY